MMIYFLPMHQSPTLRYSDFASYNLKVCICITRTHLQLQSVSNRAFPSSHRELQYLADQERISPAAIKKTTLDKVLQQPGVAVSGVPNGNGRSGLSLFNARSPGIKKNWVHKGRHTKTLYRLSVPTCTHVDIITLFGWTAVDDVKTGLRTGLTSHPNWQKCQIIYSYLSYMQTVDPVVSAPLCTQAQVYSECIAHSYSLMLGCRITIYTYTNWRAKVHLQSVACLCSGSRRSRAVKW